MRRWQKFFTLSVASLGMFFIQTVCWKSLVTAQEHQHNHAPSNSKELHNPLAATEENVANGRALYQQNCVSCHGTDGKAQTEKAMTMKVKPANLTLLYDQADGEIFSVVTTGIKTSGMPAFAARLSETERWQLALYVRHLSGAHQMPMSSAKEATTPQQHQGHMPMPMKQEPEAKAKMGGEEHADHQMNATAKTEHMGHSMNGSGMSDQAMSEMMTVTGGPFRSMQALGSGTALQPASTPMAAWMWMPGEWMLMLHGELKLGFNHQGGPRGVGKAESENWLMLMAERKAGPGRLMLRSMVSAEPLTTPHGGFPLLFQTGETYRGRPIIDAQHPHDLFMELAASYTIPISENISFQVYGGPVAEPALGPVAFMHRASAMENPSAPLGHHWQDSTHITHGVMTGALTAWRFKFEASGFHGAEPDEDRVRLDMGKLDSYSFRTWFTPTPNWAMQVSYGYLKDPETLTTGDLKRLSSSISYNRNFTDGSWASTLIWGRNSEEHGNSNSYLFESTFNFERKNHLFTRLELLDKQGLLADNIFGRRGIIRMPFIPPGTRGINLPEEFERWFRVGAFSFGGVRDFVENEKLRIGLGADITFYHKPSALDPIYGHRPVSYQIFLRFRPGQMR